MQLDRFTVKAQEALQQAQAIAQRYSHQQIDGEHLMLALLEQSEGLLHPLLQKLGAVPDERRVGRIAQTDTRWIDINLDDRGSDGRNSPVVSYLIASVTADIDDQIRLRHHGDPAKMRQMTTFTCCCGTRMEKEQRMS